MYLTIHKRARLIIIVDENTDITNILAGAFSKDLKFLRLIVLKNV